MSTETIITRSILEDGFTPVLRKIAGEQDAYARKTAALNSGGNVLIGAGAALIGFGVKSLKVAGEINEIRVALTAVEGAQRAAFDMDVIDKFAQGSKYTYLELAHAGERLALANVNVKDSLGDMADLAAASHKPLAQVAKLYDTLLAGHNVPLALSARGGFSQFYISPEAIFRAAGKEYIPGKTKLIGSMTPQEVAAAVHKVLVSTGRTGLNEKLAHTTLEGTQGLIQDAMVRIGNNVAGGQNINDTVKLLDTIATDLNKIADIAATIPNLGEKILGGGVGIVAAGAILKTVSAFREYRNMANLAKIAGAAERAGEAAKVPIAKAEAVAVEGAAVKYTGLRAILMKTGAASLGARVATTSLTGVMAAGIGTVGLYGLAFAGLVFDIGLVVKSFMELNNASRDFEASTAAMSKAKSQGYDLANGGGKATGYYGLPVWKQYGEELANGVAGFATYGKYKPFNTDDGGITATSDASSRALAAKHGMAPRGIRAQIGRAHV